MTTTNELSVDVVKQEYIDTLTTLIKTTREQLEELGQEKKEFISEFNSKISSIRSFKWYLEDCADKARPVAFLDVESHAKYLEEIKEKSKTDAEKAPKDTHDIFGFEVEDKF